MTDFQSEEFQVLLSRYEKSQREGNACYMDIDDYVDLSDYFLENNQPDKALSLAEEGLDQHPDDDLLHSVRAGVLIYLHRFEEASEIVSSLSSDDNYDVMYLQGQLAWASEGNVEKAERLFHEWIKCVEEDYCNGSPLSDDDDEDRKEEDADRELREAYVHVIMSYIELSKADHTNIVRSWLEDYVGRFDELGIYECDFVIADVCHEENQMDLFETIHIRFLDRDPYLDHGWTVLAAAQQILGKYDEALNSLEFALAIDPDDNDSLLTKAHCHFGLKQYELALAAFLKFREKTGSRNEDQFIAACYINTDDNQAAVPYLDSTLKELKRREKKHEIDSEGSAWAYHDLADGYLSCDMPDTALPLIKKAVRLLPGNLELELLHATILLANDRLEDAIRQFTYYIAHSQNMAEAMADAGTRFLLYDYPQIAEALLLASLRQENTQEAFTGRDDTYAFLSFAEYRLGNIEDALKYLDKACELTPELVKRVFADIIPDTVPLSDYSEYIAKRLNK